MAGSRWTPGEEAALLYLRAFNFADNGPVLTGYKTLFPSSRRTPRALKDKFNMLRKNQVRIPVREMTLDDIRRILEYLTEKQEIADWMESGWIERVLRTRPGEYGALWWSSKEYSLLQYSLLVTFLKVLGLPFSLGLPLGRDAVGND